MAESELAPRVVAARSLVEAAYSTLRREILDGTLQPGSKLRFEMLRQRYGFGASTMREALTRLVGESLVTSEEQRGFRVAEISLEDVADLTQVRKLIEVEALRQSILNGDDVWEANLVAAFHRLSKVEARLPGNRVAEQDAFEDANRAFHMALIEACPSRWLKQMHGVLFQQTERYRRVCLCNRVVPRDVHAEHAAVMEAVLARDVERACELERDHIQRTLDVLKVVFADQVGTKGRARKAESDR